MLEGKGHIPMSQPESEILSCCSVAQSCLILFDPMDCNPPGFSVFHCLPKFAQPHVL